VSRASRAKFFRRTLLVLAAVGLLAGCTTMPWPTSSYYPAASAGPAGTAGPRSRITTASWYGPGFSGRRTASGEVFHQNDLTAASRTLPLGSRVRVTNVVNGRSVVVRINDRGPYVSGRSIDLSRTAAERIGMAHQGVGTVKISRLDAGLGGVEPVPAAPVSYAGLADIWSEAPHRTWSEPPPREWIWHVKVTPYHPHYRRRSRRYRARIRLGSGGELADVGTAPLLTDGQPV
jgi:rare lipoprotein A